MYTRTNKLVSNTYPAFLWTFDEVSKGRNISDKLMNILEHGEFFIELNNVIQEVYDGCTYHQAINVYRDSSTLLFDTESNEIGFFLLETNKYLILLDIVDMNNFDGVLELIPSRIMNYDIHAKEVTIGNKKYKITNTYDSLLSYAKLNNLKIGLDLNSEFYNRFLQSLNIDSPLDIIINADRSVEEFFMDKNGGMVNTDRTFDYVIVDNIIIVTEYGIF